MSASFLSSLSSVSSFPTSSLTLPSPSSLDGSLVVVPQLVIIYSLIFFTIYILSSLIFLYIPRLGFSSVSSPSASASASPSASPSSHRIRPYNASSRIIGLVHVSFLLPPALFELFNFFVIRTEMYLSPNTSLEIRLIEWSLSYFIVDFVHFFVFEREDIFLLIHHSISILFFYTVLDAGYGGYSYLAAAVSGEITNPIQSLWVLAKIGGYKRLYNMLSPLFTLSFVCMRCVVVPLLSYDIVTSYYKKLNEKVLSWSNTFYPCLWGVMCVLMTAGGVVWSVQLVKGYFKSKRKREKERENKEKKVK